MRLVAVVAAVAVLWGCASREVVVRSDVPENLDRDVFDDLDLPDAEVISHEAYDGAAKILHLTSGAVFIQAGMEIDADGSPNAKTLDPLYGQLTTSLQYPGVEGQARFVDSETVPYIVLPRGFYELFGIGLGDLVAVSYQQKIVFAIFADVGPAGKMGEGSIRLAEMLGHRPWEGWTDGETLSTHGGISWAGVRYLVFPGSRIEGLGPRDAEARIRHAGAKLIDHLELGEGNP